MQIGDNLHGMSNLFSGKNKRNISVCHLLKILPRVLSIKRPFYGHKFEVFIVEWD